MNIINQIAAIPLFESLSINQHKNLAKIIINKNYKHKETIFLEGETANDFYVVASGKVKIFKLSPNGKEQILHIWGTGEPFGEVAVFEGKFFPANAESISKSCIFLFPRAAFIELIKNDHLMSLNMLAVLSKRLRKFTMLVEDLSLKEVPGRLARYFIYLSNQKKGSHKLVLDVSKIQLAGLLGTIPETLSRILTKMKDNDLISIDGKKITILDPKSLEDIVNGIKFN